MCIAARLLWGEAPIHKAAENGHDKVVSLLLEAGADKDIKNNDGDATLHLATREGYDKIVSLLLEAGADKGIKNKSGANLSASCFAGGLGWEENI